MQIDKININNYGNLSNKEIDFKNKINVIYGKNEAGKSTILSFIESMFFGVNKNKNNKTISDFDKYEPWNNQEFSGTIDYTLENGQEFHVYRDFRKKNPQILDKLGKDITQEYNIDKKTGSEFFIEQTGIDRNLINSTIITEQNHVELDEGVQNQLLQKIANLSESGQEELSYKKVSDKLNKILLNEVGTERSQQKPINITKENIKNYENKINEIKQYDNERFEIANQILEFESAIDEEKNNKEIYQEIKKVIDNDKIEQEKIDDKIKNAKENEQKIKEIEEDLKKTDKEKRKEKEKNKKVQWTITFVLVLVAIATLYFTKIIIISIIILILIPIFIFANKHQQKETSNFEYKNKLEYLKETNKKLNNEIETMQDNLYKNDEEEKIRIIRKYNEKKAKSNNYNINNEKIKNIYEIDYKDKNQKFDINSEEITGLFNTKIDDVISNIVNNIEQNEINKHKLEIDMQEIEKKYEKLAEYEENLEIEKRKLEKLEHKQKIIKTTMEILDKSYADMKENVTPKFNKNLSKNIEIFSKGKYNELLITDKINVKLENGQTISIEKLSTGTIEQIYLAFRLSVINEISKEKMPIILDEAFAFYDDDRLLQTMKFLNENENQVIILTCTNREKHLLDNNKIEYNLINL